MAGNRFRFSTWGLGRLVAVLREPVPVDAEALARMKAAVCARVPRWRLAGPAQDPRGFTGAWP